MGSNPAIPTKTKESTGIQKPVLFLCGTRTRDPGPLRGQQQSPQEFAAGDKTIKRACGASTGLQPGGRSPYNKMKNDAKRRIPLSRRKNKNLAVRHLCFRLPFLRFVVGYVFLPFSSPILWFYVVFCRKYLQKNGEFPCEII